MAESRELSKLTVKVEVDVSEAVTALKSLQREAKQATKELRELENVRMVRNDVLVEFNSAEFSGFDLSGVSTETLKEELSGRQFIGIERETEYCEIARQRIADALQTEVDEERTEE